MNIKKSEVPNRLRVKLLFTDVMNELEYYYPDLPVYSKDGLFKWYDGKFNHKLNQLLQKNDIALECNYQFKYNLVTFYDLDGHYAFKYIFHVKKRLKEINQKQYSKVDGFIFPINKPNQIPMSKEG